MFTWQPVDNAPVAKVQVTVMLPLSSITAMEDWRPVVSVSGEEREREREREENVVDYSSQKSTKSTCPWQKRQIQSIIITVPLYAACTLSTPTCSHDRKLHVQHT